MTIYELADMLELEIIVNRFPNQNNRWMARFLHCEVMENGLLRGAFGNGKTPESALEDYLVDIRGKHVAINATSPGRREFHVPETTNLGGD